VCDGIHGHDVGPSVRVIGLADRLHDERYGALGPRRHTCDVYGVCRRREGQDAILLLGHRHSLGGDLAVLEIWLWLVPNRSS